MDVQYAFAPEDYAKHMNVTGACEVENGYCVLPDGVNCVSVCIPVWESRMEKS